MSGPTEDTAVHPPKQTHPAPSAARMRVPLSSPPTPQQPPGGNLSNKELAAAVEAADRHAVERLAFLPTNAEIDQLFVHARKAEGDREKSQRTRLLSKLPYVPTLCPSSGRAGDTVLSRLGTTSAIIAAGRFALIPDKALVYWLSNGPNAVVTDCPDRLINLFSSGCRRSAAALLSEYLAIRPRWLGHIIQAIPDKIAACGMPDGSVAANFPHEICHDGGGVLRVPAALWPAYRLVAVLFAAAVGAYRSALAAAAVDADPVIVLRESIGLAVVSFCQTWMRGNGRGVGDAEFSVMSPHFQNRVIVVNAAQLQVATGLGSEHLEAYLTVSRKMDQCMEQHEYCGANGAAFIHLDKLHGVLAGHL
jgi:hypothetical protein